ncbi:MAG TPA: hypothetical protein VMZ73_08645 [Acidimicrobiales bacterium]|nr:hypothetical protein [Acidimicrobiales bacterium]
MTSSILQRLITVSATALLAAGVAGVVVHQDDSDGGTAALDDSAGTPETTAPAVTSEDAIRAGGTTMPAPAPTSTPVPTTASAATTAPAATSTRVPTTAPVPATPADPGVGAASTSVGEVSAGTPGSGLATTGNGEVASGTTPLAATGSYAMGLLGALCLALAGAGRALLRAATPRTR